MKARLFHLTPNRALAAYAVLFSGIIIWASVPTALGQDSHHGGAMRWLGLLEIAGAVLFVAPKTRFAGLVTLLAVFAIASAIEWHLGLTPLRLIFYAASGVLVQYLSRSLPPD